jgi:hypothetical protein
MTQISHHGIDSHSNSCCFVFCGIGVWTQGLFHFLGRCSTTWATCPAYVDILTFISSYPLYSLSFNIFRHPSILQIRALRLRAGSRAGPQTQVYWPQHQGDFSWLTCVVYQAVRRGPTPDEHFACLCVLQFWEQNPCISAELHPQLHGGVFLSLDVVTHTCNPRHLQGRNRRNISPA